MITNSDAKPTLGSGGCLAQAVAVVTEEPYQKVLDGLDAQIPNVAAAGGTSVAGDCWTPAVVLAYYKHCYSGGNFSWGHVDKTSIMPRLTEDQIAALSPGELNKELVKHDIAKLRNRKKPTIRKARDQFYKTMCEKAVGEGRFVVDGKVDFDKFFERSPDDDGNDRHAVGPSRAELSLTMP